jgi:uncharacterized DUF497 family protein
LVRIDFDPVKRLRTLEARGLDMARAEEVFEGPSLTFTDVRFAYGEERFVTVGFLSGRMVVLAWTERGNARRIISMRKANEREQERFGGRLG